MENFLSLRHLLEEDHLAPESLVATIDQYGIDHLFHPEKPPIKHGRNRWQSYEAISLLSAYVDKTSGNGKLKVKSFLYQDIDLDRLGWMRLSFELSSAKPRLSWLKQLHKRSDLFTLWSPSLLTVGRVLLMEKADIGAIATAIETLGIHGIDRFGRIKWYAPQSEEAKLGLDELALFYTEHLMLPSILDAFSNKSIFQRFGWMHERSPDLKAIEAEHERLQLAQLNPASSTTEDDDSPNGAKAKMTVIAGLLALSDGRLTGRKHPEFESQASLVALLSARLNPLYGSKEGAIDRKFGEANKILKALNLATTKVSGKKPAKKAARQRSSSPERAT